MPQTDDSLIEYPCQFPIKAMGKADADFVAHVLNLVSQHCEDIPEESIRTQPSHGGKYISVTVVIEATSREQLDAIYLSLTDSKRVLMAL